MPNEVVEQLPRALLEVSLLLGAAVLISLITRKIHIQLTVVLAVAGLLATEMGADLAVSQMLSGEGFKELLIHLFLPILIFEAALGLSTREFMRNLLAISALASVALVIAAAVVGASLTLFLGIPLVAALLFGVLISATDPVAVVAIFRELGVPKRLLTVVEGESLLNDGVAIVLYNILVIATVTGMLSVGAGAVDFVVVVAGGIVTGAVVGTLAVLLLPLLDRLAAAAMSIAVAYGSFVFAEAVLHASGVMAAVAAGITVGGLMESRAQHAARDLLHELWASLGYMANALLFLFIGLALDFQLIRDNLAAIGLGIAAVLISRPLGVIPVVLVLERLARIPRVGNRNSAVVVWGGLRGGVALALALALPLELGDLRDQFIAMTGGIVLATLLINATTISFVVHSLGLDKPSRKDEYLEALARMVAVRSARERLDDLGFSDELVNAHLDVAEADARDQLARTRLNAQEQVDVLELRGLHIQRETYQSLSDAGLLPPIATRTLMQEIDDEIEEVSEGGLRIDEARRACLPWYARLHRFTLGKLPPPLGEDLDEVGYIEICARRLAAHNAADELELFKSLPNVEVANVETAKRLFLHWEERATETLETLGVSEKFDERVLRRRQAKALSRIAIVEALQQMVSAGVMSQQVADEAAERVSTEVQQAGE
ncbi:sodium:proton antiporter [Hoyosella sp. YIM 151337]|uniref:cation:proton antiporter n=1 Tax=Hoyosella sp. YIM 151337 TaxID=2992742 RepID=UPI002235BCD4|nr:sodium:proton antiporter [Hoyosella sp. YIM 151337]MCW4354824.1 sodium:proton antiporter [Hoyosella sp. YIM 151337]